MSADKNLPPFLTIFIIFYSSSLFSYGLKLMDVTCICTLYTRQKWDRRYNRNINEIIQMKFTRNGSLASENVVYRTAVLSDMKSHKVYKCEERSHNDSVYNITHDFLINRIVSPGLMCLLASFSRMYVVAYIFSSWARWLVIYFRAFIYLFCFVLKNSKWNFSWWWNSGENDY